MQERYSQIELIGFLRDLKKRVSGSEDYLEQVCHLLSVTQECQDDKDQLEAKNSEMQIQIEEVEVWVVSNDIQSKLQLFEMENSKLEDQLIKKDEEVLFLGEAL